MIQADFKLILAIIRQESGFDPNAKSHAGAEGLMQLMPPTFKEWAEIVKFKKPDVRNPIQNVIAGCLEINRQLQSFKDIRLALAAYNWGSGNLRSLMRRRQLTKFEDLQPFLPRETRNYVRLVTQHYNDPQTTEMIL